MENKNEPSKTRCECELFVEKYFGIGPVNERTPIEADYGQLVNLLVMFRDESKPINEAIELLERYTKFLQKNGYIDTDATREEPYAIDEFLKQEKRNGHLISDFVKSVLKTF